MKTFKVTFTKTGKVMLVPANSQIEIAEKALELGVGGIRIQNTVRVTCAHWVQEGSKWVRHTHNWIDTLDAVKGQRSCPKHRSS